MRGSPVLLLVVLLSGCAAPSVEPERLPEALDDRNPLPIDFEAPAPSDDYDAVPLLEPESREPYTLRGRVLDAGGRGVAGAVVAVEAANLREPVNNLAEYRSTLAATRTVTAADGSYALLLEGGFYHVLARQPGFLPGRAEPEVLDDQVVEQDIHIARDDGPLVVAHRGASFYAPENTLAALHKAFLLGAGAVEVDVRWTRDEVLVLVHDDTLDRTTTGSGRVRDWDWAELRALDAGGWFDPSFRGERVPTLAEALELAAEYGGRVVIDQKGPAGDADRFRAAAIKAVRDGGHERRVTIATFRDEGIQACRNAGLLSCLLFTNPTAPARDLIDRAERVGAHVVVVTRGAVNGAVLEYAGAAGVQIWAGTTNLEHQWTPLVDVGVAAILTDRPGYLVDHLGEMAAGATRAS